MNTRAADPEISQLAKRPSCEVILCRGFTSCPHALADPQLSSLESRLQLYTDPLHCSKNHRRPFHVSISLCPNGCSRPQISDIGIIAVDYPYFDYTRCTGCGICVESCREDVLRINKKGRPGILDTCIGCGDCFTSCPESALTHGKKRGYRILLGGKLGRHPRLGEDTGIIYSADRVLDRSGDIYAYWLNSRLPGERLRDVITRKGLP